MYRRAARAAFRSERSDNPPDVRRADLKAQLASQINDAKRPV